jgi:hypothetical protein
VISIITASVSVVLVAVATTTGVGLTSVSPNEPIEAGFRMFTIYSEHCSRTPLPAYILTYGPLNLKVGDEFVLTDPIVTAHDESGKLIPKAPITILNLNENNDVLRRDPHRNRVTYVALRPGTKTFRFKSRCPDGDNVFADLSIVVTEK